MMDERKNIQEKMYITTMKKLMPQNHFLRKLQSTLDFGFVYDKVRHLYSNKGRRSIDPVILIKSLLIGYLYGIDSERELERRIQVNIAFKWFLGVGLDDHVPDHSTISQNRRRRFKESKIFEEVFNIVVQKCIETGLVGGESVVMDSTHVKANASIDSIEKVIVMKGPNEYLQKVEREALKLEMKTGKLADKKLDKNQKHEPGVKKRIETKSSTDPDAGWMNRYGKPKGFQYLCHQVADIKHGIITDIHATPANENDHESCVERIREQKIKFRLSTKEAGLDIGYDYVNVHHGLHEIGITAYTPARDSDKLRTSKVFSSKRFKYSIEKNEYICPNNKELKFSYVHRHKDRIKKIYSGKAEFCQVCPMKKQCLSSKANFRTLSRPFNWETLESNHMLIGTHQYKYLQYKRKIICEGNFALMKENYNLRRTRKRGIKGANEHCLLSAIALNLKRLVKYQFKPVNELTSHFFSIIKSNLRKLTLRPSF